MDRGELIHSYTEERELTSLICVVLELRWLLRWYRSCEV